MSDDFQLDKFVRKIQNAGSLTEEEVTHRQKSLKAMRMVLDAEHLTPEKLDSVSFEDLEWAIDVALFWPSADISRDEDDPQAQEDLLNEVNHPGYQHVQVRTMIKVMSTWKSIQKKVNFI